MGMQNVMQQITSMLSLNDSKDAFSVSMSTGTMGEQFHSVMSGEMSKKSTSNIDVRTTKDHTTKTVGVQTVNEKRQQELRSLDNPTSKSQETGMGNKEIQNVQQEAITPEELETVAQWICSVQQQICQELSVSPEELEGVTEQLGLQFTDLQDIGNVQQLVLAVSGEDDAAALLTNEELSSHVQNIMQVVTEATQEMAEQLQIPEDEVAQLLNIAEGVLEVQNREPEQVVSTWEESRTMMEIETVALDQETVVYAQEKETTGQNNKETIGLAEDSSQQQAELVLETDEKSQEIMETLDVVTAKQTEVSNSENELMDQVGEDALDVDAKQVDATNSISPQEEADGEMESSSDGNDFFKGKGQQQKDTPVMEQVLNQVSVAKAQFAETIQEKVQATQQMQEIFDQVVEQVRVTVTADTSEMEMQLNPENLGKVNLSVVAKEGHITARFVTENEVARQALESQLIQLRETLGEQGLKVDKVEVSVSDFSFQNGNQANAEEQKEQQREEHAKQVQRNLNLANLDDLVDMTEAEELAVKIMQSNGNQIDYTA